MAHLVGLDDWAKTELEIPRSELVNILNDQQYRYITSIDTAENGLRWTINKSDYMPLPDSIVQGSLPISLELSSSRGDFLRFYAEEKTQEILYIHLYTDWN